MADTKENILMTSLHLFARDGYEAVSVSTISGELGMTKGALYKHYKNKRDIFDSIVERMYKIDAERSVQYKVPDGLKNEGIAVSWDTVKQFTVAQYKFWTEDDFAQNFRKMLTLEQYRNEEMAKLYQSCIAAGPVAYMENIFSQMMADGNMKKADSKLLATEFFAPMYLLIGISDHSENKEQNLELLNRHIERFILQNSVDELGRKQ